MSWKKSEKLMDTIKHYSGFPATGVSLRQMVQFGERPGTGTAKIDYAWHIEYKNLATCPTD